MVTRRSVQATEGAEEANHSVILQTVPIKSPKLQDIDTTAIRDFLVHFAMYELRAKAGNIRPVTLLDCIDQRFLAGIAAISEKEIMELTSQDVEQFLTSLVNEDADNDNIGPDLLLNTIKSIKYQMDTRSAVSRVADFQLSFHDAMRKSNLTALLNKSTTLQHQAVGALLNQVAPTGLRKTVRSRLDREDLKGDIAGFFQILKTYAIRQHQVYMDEKETKQFYDRFEKRVRFNEGKRPAPKKPRRRTSDVVSSV